jgi:hypothetical protein
MAFQDAVRIGRERLVEEAFIHGIIDHRNFRFRNVKKARQIAFGGMGNGENMIGAVQRAARKRLEAWETAKI